MLARLFSKKREEISLWFWLLGGFSLGCENELKPFVMDPSHIVEMTQDAKTMWGKQEKKKSKVRVHFGEAIINKPSTVRS